MSTDSSALLEVTSLPPGSDGGGGDGTTPLPVMGWPGPNFYILHFSALTSLLISIVASAIVFAILSPRCPSFWARSVGERFAVYLAVADMMWSVSHSLDHVYMLAVLGHPPDDACTAMAYFTGTSMVVQAMMVTFMSLNAFILVVKEIKLSMGRYDWKLLTTTVLMPFIAMVIPAYFRWLGPSGGWCVYDMRRDSGRLFAFVLISINILTVIVNIVCYAFIFLKIRAVTAATQSIGSTSNGMKHKNTVSVMMKFVAAYIFQWWLHAVYGVWNMFAPAPFTLILLIVIIVNMGGLYNLVVYTLLRRKPKDTKPKPDNNKDNVSTATTATKA